MAAPRPAGRPLIPGLAALALGGGLGAFIALRTVQGTVPVAVIAAAGTLTLAASVGFGRAAGIGWAVALLAAAYAVSLVVSGARVDAAAPLVGLALVLVAELSHTSCEWRGSHAENNALERRRWARLLGAAAAGAVVGGGALAVASAVQGSVPGLLAGAGAVVGLVALATWLRASTQGDAEQLS